MEPFERITMSYKCPKALDDLQPCHSNWYCDGCQKMVYDFRGMTEAQILDAFKQSGQKLCGIYDAERIKVLPQKSKWHKWAAAAGVLLLGFIGCKEDRLLVDGQLAKNIDKQTEAVKADTVSDMVVGMLNIEVSPSFPGGEAGWGKYIQKHLNHTGGYTGKIFVSFVVEPDGSLTDVKIIRGSGTTLDYQVIQIVKDSPHWIPAIQNGKKMRVQFTVPINFTRKTEKSVTPINL